VTKQVDPVHEISQVLQLLGPVRVEAELHAARVSWNKVLTFQSTRESKNKKNQMGIAKMKKEKTKLYLPCEAMNRHRYPPAKRDMNHQEG